MAMRTYGKYSGKSPTEKLTDARQALFNALLADMEREGSRWVKEWSFPHPPMNGVTGKGYGPRNTAMLMYAMRDGGFRDPRFSTFKMASDKGCHIIKGSHGYPIERWKRMLVSKSDPSARLKQPKTQEEWDIALANPDYKAEPRCVGTFTVFNAEQMENTENLVSVECFKPIEPDRVADPAVKCTLPTGTKVDGKDLSGFNFTTFQKPWNKADIEAGKGTGVFVNADRNVSLFKYDQDGQRHDESVEPQKLSDAVEAARAEYREQHQSHDRSQEQETGLDELCEQKTAEANERESCSQDRSPQNVQR